MNFGIDALLLSDQSDFRQSGVSRYIDRLIAHLDPLLGEDRLIAFCQRGIRAPGIQVITCPAPALASNRAARILWQQAGLPVQARRDQLAVLHGPANALPLLRNRAGVVTIHDLAFLKWPDQVPRARHAYLSRAVRSAAARADRIIAPSVATRGDIIELLGAPPERIAVVPLGVDPIFAPSPAGKRASPPQRSSNRPYVLAAGTLEPRKNLPRLMDAFSRIVDDVPHDLVLCGADGWLTDEIRVAATNPRLQNRLQLTGFVANEDLPEWYRGADLFVIPSLYEGFGLTLLEAMASGVPAAASHVSSLPEVGGDAVRYFDPADPAEIARVMLEILQQPDLADLLRQLGPVQAARFTWQRTATETLAIYREVAR